MLLLTMKMEEMERTSLVFTRPSALPMHTAVSMKMDPWRRMRAEGTGLVFTRRCCLGRKLSIAMYYFEKWTMRLV